MLELIKKHSYHLWLIRYVVLLVLYIMVMVHWMHQHIHNLDWAETIIVYVIGFEVGASTVKYIEDVWHAWHH